MKEYNLTTKMKSYQWDELTDEQREVVSIAKEQTENSYCPYSGFHVGAAAKLANGVIMRGANQENAAYPSGLCAERSAIFAAQSQHPEFSIKTIAIAARNDDGFTRRPISPCGACRQVMMEMEDRYKSDVRVLLYGVEGVYAIRSIKDLLPVSFVDDCMR